MNARDLANRCAWLLLLVLPVACQHKPSVPEQVSAAACGRESAASLAPPELRARSNPLAPTGANLAAGLALYERDARPRPCIECHGARGRGNGVRAPDLVPPPTNFHCPEFATRPDGQLFWVIHEGANYLGEIKAQTAEKRPGRRPAITAMRPHRYFLNEEQTWQLVLYLRHLTTGTD